ncbi:class I SAM-dependent methyltransferase [Ningiella sp. W23]|uniref:class I SAM-dependent methyltransferase n=1 Tax=Ningiella sp. W23 TaxID=3023715 RepID=UPI003757D2FD
MNKWLEYWKQDELNEDVFTDKQGRKHEKLKAFWQSKFSSIDGESQVLDVASGAGAVFRCLDSTSSLNLHALDISADALDKLKSDFPNCTTYPMALDSAKFEEKRFDLIVSQFGIEYLGFDGFLEAAKLMSDGGQCVFLSHYESGAIDIITQQSLHGLQQLQKNEFLAKAKRVAQAFIGDERRQVEAAVADFMNVEPLISQSSASMPESHHAHVYNGVKQLLSNFNQYENQHILDWLSTASNQVSENLMRLQSMHNAALSQSDIDELNAQLSSFGVKIELVSPFYLREGDLPVAWEIHAQKYT